MEKKILASQFFYLFLCYVFCLFRGKRQCVFLTAIAMIFSMSLITNWNFLPKQGPNKCPRFLQPLYGEISVVGQTRTVKVRHPNDFKVNARTPKTILLWTSYFSEEYSNDYYFFQRGAKTFENYKCEFKDCLITSNVSLLKDAHAVIFHATDLNFTHLPRHRTPDQIWILYGLESPWYIRTQWYKARALFNWTMNYRDDSDVQVKYGEVLPVVRPAELSKTLNTSCFKKRNILSDKTGYALWLVSNCRTQSRRESYVKELKKHYPVDIYGECGNLKCSPPQSSDCYQNLLTKYKFYLSFENSICKDYVTEKFFNILNYDIIPVVLGGANYERVAPPHSYIDAMHFLKPKDLALFLRKVETNPDLYKSYFQWKKSYQVHLHPWMCDLCRKLQEHTCREPSVHKNMWSWWIANSSCKSWSRKYGFRDLLKNTLRRKLLI